jgi:hypothetical protein
VSTPSASAVTLVPPAAAAGSDSAALVVARSAAANSAGLPSVPTDVLPEVLGLPIAQLRKRAAQASTRNARGSDKMKIWRQPEFFHTGSACCWNKILKFCKVVIQTELVDGKKQVSPTL